MLRERSLDPGPPTSILVSQLASAMPAGGSGDSKRQGRIVIYHSSGRTLLFFLFACQYTNICMYMKCICIHLQYMQSYMLFYRCTHVYSSAHSIPGHLTWVLCVWVNLYIGFTISILTITVNITIYNSDIDDKQYYSMLLFSHNPMAARILHACFFKLHLGSLILV